MTTETSSRTRRGLIKASLAVIAFVCLACLPARASGSNSYHVDEMSRVLVALLVALIAAKLGGELFVRMGQPAVLGELVFGIVVGNLELVHYGGLRYIKTDQPVEILSEIGIILLLFQVGLESDFKKMLKVGPSSLVAASLGVVASFTLGAGVAMAFLPHASRLVHLFVGTMVASTSVGIAARVFYDLGRIQTEEASTVLGTAIVDDVMGLVLLGIMSGVITAAGTGSGALSGLEVAAIVLKAVAFLAGSIVIGRWVTPRLLGVVSRFRGSDLLLTTSLGLCFALGYLSKAIGLAPIIGAFAAGLCLEEAHWRSFVQRGEQSVLQLVRPLVGFLAPVFFFRMGARVDLLTFAQPAAIGFAAALTLAAILGKQACGLGVLKKGLDRVTIGIGMIPRGEVILIAAAIGANLIIKGAPVVSPATYSAIVIVVVVTILITPPLLKWRLGRG